MEDAVRARERIAASAARMIGWTCSRARLLESARRVLSTVSFVISAPLIANGLRVIIKKINNPKPKEVEKKDD